LRESGITSFYWQYFQTPGVAEAEFERDVSFTMRTLLGRGFSDPAASLFIEPGKSFLGDARAIRPLPSWLGDADLAYFSEAYQRSGFRGGLNWYRNIDRNWELTAPWQDAQIHQPSLFIAGSRDSVITGLIGQTCRRYGAGAAEFEKKADCRRRRPLGSAGTRRRGQCRLDWVSQGRSGIRRPGRLSRDRVRPVIRWDRADQWGRRPKRA
jgi:pimeloyl-ACP methyl ester carboxylesterase